MNVNYKKAYEDLKNYLINLRPYCDNCEARINACDECNRKYFNWSFDEECLKPLSDYELINEMED